MLSRFVTRCVNGRQRVTKLTMELGVNKHYVQLTAYLTEKFSTLGRSQNNSRVMYGR